MGKIWLKSVDPNRQCCGCEGKTGPCDSCCNPIETTTESIWNIPGYEDYFFRPGGEVNGSSLAVTNGTVTLSNTNPNAESIAITFRLQYKRGDRVRVRTNTFFQAASSPAPIGGGCVPASFRQAFMDGVGGIGFLSNNANERFNALIQSAGNTSSAGTQDIYAKYFTTLCDSSTVSVTPFMVVPSVEGGKPSVDSQTIGIGAVAASQGAQIAMGPAFVTANGSAVFSSSSFAELRYSDPQWVCPRTFNIQCGPSLPAFTYNYTPEVIPQITPTAVSTDTTITFDSLNKTDITTSTQTNVSAVCGFVNLRNNSSIEIRNANGDLVNITSRLLKIKVVEE